MFGSIMVDGVLTCCVCDLKAAQMNVQVRLI